MRVLHVNTNDTLGGASIAAMRLHKAMLGAGIDSTFFCLNRTINDDDTILTINKKNIFINQLLNKMLQKVFRKVYLSNAKGLFSNMRVGIKIGKYIKLNTFDIIYLHWVNDGFLSLKGLEELCKTRKKIIWFMHDMFPITGGCHHSFSCDGYMKNCDVGSCPYLKNQYFSNFAYKQLKQKRKIFEKYSNISFVAPSKWLFDCTKSSSIVKGHNVFHIQNLLNPNIFRKLDKESCRNILNFPNDKKIILFGADSALTNPYKGFEFFVNALKYLMTNLSIKQEDIQIVIFGSSYNKTIEKAIPFKTIFMGSIHDSYTLSILYNASNVFCISSIAENFSNTILEAINCNIPVVGFEVGGIPDMVNEDTGYLAEYKNSVDFAKGISYVLNHQNKFNFQNKITYVDEIISKHIKVITD